jgi:hypothetical protein
MRLKFYLTSVLTVFGFAAMAQSGAQEQHEIDAPANDIFMNETKVVRTSNTAKGGDEPEVFWSEDFSNGFDGQGENGAWTFDGENGDLWFITFPLGAPDGYDPLAPLTTTDAYGDIIPNFNNNIATIPSTTADNGFVMMDADRFNSITNDPNNQGVDFLTSNVIDAILVSPPIDLTGVENALLSFWQQWRMCCSSYEISVEFSTDGGDTWIPFNLWDLNGGTGNVTTSNNFGINISDILQAADDLTDCRIRYIWDPIPNPDPEGANATHYYCMFDDIQIVEIPDNDIAIGDTYINNFFESPDEEPDLDYVRKFEYWNQPDYITRPFNFATDATNNGTLEQTNVTLQVVALLDGDSIDSFVSDPINLAPGETDTLRIYDVAPSWWINDEGNPEPGVYSFQFEIFQDAEDQRPEDNVGVTRTTRISNDMDNGGFAFMQNDRDAFTNFYPTLGDDVIWGNRFVFTEPDVAEEAVITHVEFILSGSVNAPSTPGEVMYVNVRTGSVLSEEGPDNEMFRYFEEDEIEYTVLEEDLGEWVSIELPTPILIETDKIFQAEAQVPPIGSPAIIHAQSNLQEPGAGVLYDFAMPSGGPQGWFTLGDLAPLLRFRTQDASSINTENLTYESGIKLTQNHPNPFTDNTMIQFQLDESSPVTFEVFDISGKLVHSEDFGNVPARTAQVFMFNRENLAPGIYTYSIVTEKERVSRKLTVR